jgi:hypothetical protein
MSERKIIFVSDHYAILEGDKVVGIVSRYEPNGATWVLESFSSSLNFGTTAGPSGLAYLLRLATRQITNAPSKD